MKVFFLVPMDVGNLSNHVKSMCFSFRFSLIFHQESLHKNQHIHIENAFWDVEIYKIKI